jgi:hypothetical protein
VGLAGVGWGCLGHLNIIESFVFLMLLLLFLETFCIFLFLLGYLNSQTLTALASFERVILASILYFVLNSLARAITDLIRQSNSERDLSINSSAYAQINRIYGINVIGNCLFLSQILLEGMVFFGLVYQMNRK